MKLKLFFALIIFNYSCSSNDSPVESNENLLTNNIWKKIHYKEIKYFQDETSNTTINNVNAGTETLAFDLNKNVTYVDPIFTNSIQGTWNFTENEQVLVTNLTRQFPSSSGFGIVPYFNNCKIERLTESELILVSDTTYNFSESLNLKSVIKYYFSN